MNGFFRQSMSWLHTWAGLTFGWVLYFMFITGTAGYFDAEIDHWMEPELPFAGEPLSQAELLGMAETYYKQTASNATDWFINFPDQRESYLNLSWETPKDNKDELEEGEEDHIDGDAKLDPQTAQVITAEPRATGGGYALYVLHYALHYLPSNWATWIVSLCSMFMLVGLITGVIVHKKIFKEFFTFRPNKKQRSWLDMHNLFGVLSLPFLLMITYSGLVILCITTMLPIVYGAYGSNDNSARQFTSELFERFDAKEAAGTSAVAMSPQRILSDLEDHWGLNQISYLSVAHRGDINSKIEAGRKTDSGLGFQQMRVYDGVSGELLYEHNVPKAPTRFLNTIFDLHYGRFAGTVLRWFYFLSGLLGAGMVGTGLILWTVKRKAVAEKSGIPHKGLALVERLNVGTIAGLPIAIAVYFWANRLIPVSFEGRAEWEVHALFIAWALTLILPIFRSVQRTWIELLGLAALLYSLLPILNFLATERHLAISIPQGDWVMVGFDLTMLVFGIIFGTAAFKLYKKEATSNVSTLLDTGNAPVDLASS